MNPRHAIGVWRFRLNQCKPSNMSRISALRGSFRWIQWEVTSLCFRTVKLSGSVVKKLDVWTPSHLVISVEKERICDRFWNQNSIQTRRRHAWSTSAMMRFNIKGSHMNITHANACMSQSPLVQSRRWISHETRKEWLDIDSFNSYDFSGVTRERFLLRWKHSSQSALILGRGGIRMGWEKIISPTDIFERLWLNNALPEDSFQVHFSISLYDIT